MKRIVTLAALAALLILPAAGAPGAPLGGPRGRQDDDNQKNTALLKIYPKIEDLTSRAEKLAADGKYAAALEIYQQAWQTHPNHVVPDGSPRVLGVWEFAMDKISKWPEGGRAVYRQTFDPRAQEIFERAKRTQDIEALEDLVERYPLSSLVDDALMLLANLALEESDPDRAVRALERVISRENTLPAPILFARLGEAYAQAHEKERLERLWKRAESEQKAAKIRVRGKEESLVDYLFALNRSTTARVRDSRMIDIPAWPMIGGGPTGSRPAESGCSLGSHAWGVHISLPSFENEDDLQYRHYGQPALSDGYKPLYPAVADGIVYVHNEYAVFAYNLFGKSSDPLWTYLLQRPDGSLMFEDRVVHATTVHGGRVFANLVTSLGNAEEQLSYVRVKFPFPRRALFALDAYSGRFLWKLGGRPKADLLEDNASFSTAPTPEADRLYVGAIKQKFSTDPFEHYVLCLDAATGRILWSTFVASGLTEINLFGNSTRESLGTPVAIGGDTLYYGTNLGIFAALDKKTGRLKWAYRYPQLPMTPTRSVYIQRNRQEWENSSPVVAQGQVIFTPADSRWLISLDAATGERKWRVRRTEEVRQVYGVRDNLLVVGGEELRVYNIAAGGKLTCEYRPRYPGSGRGAVAEDRVYMPTAAGLASVNLTGPREIEFRAWPGRRAGGGNVTIVDGAVLLAGSDSLDVFCDPRSFEKSMQADLEREPDNAAILYRSALRLLQSGRPGEAAKLLERVVSRLSGSARPDEERVCRAARKRLYSISMDAGRDAAAAKELEKAQAQYERARENALDLTGRVVATLRLAGIRSLRNDPTGAIEALQSLLDDGPDSVVEGLRILDIVRDQVGQLIERQGRGPYSLFDKRAEEHLNRARRGGSPDDMLEVFRRYPNSLSAEPALLEAADLYARAGRPDDQTSVLRQFLRDFPESPRLEEAMASLVRSLESKGALISAAAILRRMARRRPETEVPDGESKVTVREFVHKRLESESYRKAAAPKGLSKLGPPLKTALEHAEKTFPMGAPLLVMGSVPPSAESRVFMNYATAVKAFDLTRGTEAWTHRVDAEIRFACFHEDALILATESSVQRLDPATGKVEWSYASKIPMRGFTLAGSQVCFFSADPKGGGAAGVSAVDATQGSLSWRQMFDGVAASRVWSAGEFVVFLTGSPNRVYAFEAETGKRVLAQPQNTPGITNQVLAVTETLVLVWSDKTRFIEAYQLPAGTLAWRISLADFATKIVEVNPTSLFIVGSRGRGTFAATVSLKTGKMTDLAEGIELGDPRYALIDDERAYVVSRDGERREIVVREVSLATLKVGWKQTVESKATATLFPPTIARDHLAFFMFDRSDAGKFNYSWALLDKRGQKVQNRTSEYSYERPPNYLVANDALVISVDARVEVLK